MSYFDSRFNRFFLGLSENNTKEWFESHRDTYETAVKKPFIKLVEDVMRGVSEFDTHLPLSAQKSIFRINRDIRFSKDKSPYKTHVAATLSDESKNPDAAGYYFMLSAKGLELGGGIYQPNKEAIEKIRSEIFYHSEEFDKLLMNRDFKSKFGILKGEKNKIVPDPYKQILQTQPLIANKQFFYWAEFLDPSIVESPDLADIIISHFAAGAAMNSFLRRAVLG
jgi:uncharacterized protein (TIGR02453 family)